MTPPTPSRAIVRVWYRLVAGQYGRDNKGLSVLYRALLCVAVLVSVNLLVVLLRAV